MTIQPPCNNQVEEKWKNIKQILKRLIKYYVLKRKKQGNTRLRNKLYNQQTKEENIKSK